MDYTRQAEVLKNSQFFKAVFSTQSPSPSEETGLEINLARPPKGVVPIREDDPDNAESFYTAIDYAYTRGGGVIRVPDGIFLFSKIKPRTRVKVKGTSWRSILKSIKNNPNTSLIENYDENTEFVGIECLAIDGNKEDENGAANQTKAIDGIYVNCPNGAFTWYIDPYNRISNVLIYNCTGNGIHIPKIENQKAESSYFETIIVRNCDLNGFNINSSDNFFMDCMAAGCYDGFLFNGGNNNVVNAKSYWNKRNGLYVGGSSTGSRFTNFEAQEEGMCGVYVKDTIGAEFVNITSDTHGHNNGVNTGEGRGLVLDGCSHCTFTNLSIMSRDNADLKGTLKYGISFLNNPKHNTIKAKILGVDTAANTKPFAFYDTLPPTNKLEINDIDRTLPNIAEPIARLTKSTNGTVVDGFQNAAQDGITATFSFDSSAKCQKIEITASTSVNSAFISTNYPVKAGDVVHVLAEGKKAGNVTYKCVINWYNSAGDWITTASGAASNAEMFTPVILSATAPANATSMKIMLVVIPDAIGSVGSAWFSHIILNNESISRAIDNLHKVSTTPVGSLLPHYVGEKVLNTSEGKFYEAVGLTANDWR